MLRRSFPGLLASAPFVPMASTEVPAASYKSIAGRPATRPACLKCKLLMEPAATPRNQDRSAVTFFRCTPCGVEDRHEVEKLHFEELA